MPELESVKDQVWSILSDVAIGSTSSQACPGNSNQLISNPKGIMFVDATRADDYVPDGSDNRPFKNFSDVMSNWVSIAGPITIYSSQATYGAGGNYSLPAYPLYLFANGATVTSSGTITINSDFVSYDLNTVGDVNVISSASNIRNRGIITGNLVINGFCSLRGVTITGSVTVNSGGVFEYDSSTTIGLLIDNGGTIISPIIKSEIDAALELKADISIVQTTQTGIAYTLTISDTNSEIFFTNSSGISVSIPTGIFVAGRGAIFTQMGLGQVSLAPESGFSLTSSSTFKTNKQYSTIALICSDTFNGNVIGERAAS